MKLAFAETLGLRSGPYFAARAVMTMISGPKDELRSAADYLPEKMNLSSLRRAAADCRGCDLYRDATQTVFGAGPRKAELMLVGEVPGDQEDKQGQPFVGPAGQLLDKAFEAVGLRRSDVYLTNAVKHFKYQQRGKRRLHKKPRQIEIVSCRAWLEAEILVVKPKVIVCLGATAAQSLLGRNFRITQQRGELIRSQWAPWMIATWHPSAILRAPRPEDREAMRNVFIGDLRRAVEQI